MKAATTRFLFSSSWFTLDYVVYSGYGHFYFPRPNEIRSYILQMLCLPAFCLVFLFFFLDSERKLLCSISQERTYNGFGLELYARQVSHRFGKIGFDFFLNFWARRIALGAILYEKPAGEFTPSSLNRAMVMFHFS